MAISFDLPSDVESELMSQFDDVSQAAKEAFVIEGYRTGKFGMGLVRRILGFETRWEAERWLADRHVPLSYGPKDFTADRETLTRVLGDTSDAGGG